jgi:hypothetical protein
MTGVQVVYVRSLNFYQDFGSRRWVLDGAKSSTAATLQAHGLWFPLMSHLRLSRYQMQLGIHRWPYFRARARNEILWICYNSYNIINLVSSQPSDDSYPMSATVPWTIFLKNAVVPCIWMNLDRTIKDSRDYLLQCLPAVADLPLLTKQYLTSVLPKLMQTIIQVPGASHSGKTTGNQHLLIPNSSISKTHVHQECDLS